MVDVCAEQFRNHWFAVARSSEVTSRPISILAFGRPFALVRDAKSEVLAFEDRCPHRGVPLSLGRMGREGLRCAYHGWSFGADGYCRHVPGASDSKMGANVRVPMFPVRERDGLVWISAKQSNPMPLRATAMDPAHRRFVGQLKWRAPILDAQENFLDALHTPFVHPGIVRGEAERTPVTVVVQKTKDGFVIDYSGQPRQSGWFYRLFESPRASERAYFSGMSMAQLEYRYRSGWSAWISLYFTPETATSTHVFSTLHVAGRWAPAFLIRLLVWPLLQRVGRQDQFLLEQQESSRRHFPDRHYVVTELDVARSHLETAWNHGETAVPERIDRVDMML
ncbi:MAG TPA: aromatic ring-hydroxylating dioxygenase subunit alpha [Steroidobacteraceae bacterium]|jgi:phenylpropionate dioxygenase-like ring-hydroxylating dioxygenase large terminal subunit